MATAPVFIIVMIIFKSALGNFTGYNARPPREVDRGLGPAVHVGAFARYC
jgi:hypothetical protein